MIKKTFYIFLSSVLLFVVISPAYAWADRYYNSLNHDDRATKQSDSRAESMSLIEYENYRSLVAETRRQRNMSIDSRNFLPENMDASDEVSQDDIEKKESIVTKVVDRSPNVSNEKREAASDIKYSSRLGGDKNKTTATKSSTETIAPKTRDSSLSTTLDLAKSKNQNSPSYSALEKKAFDLVNEYRIKLGLNSLVWDDKIAEVARSHSTNMAKGIVPFSHDGFNDRIVAVGKFMSIESIGENVAYNYGYDDPAQKAFDGWIASPGHLKNIKGDYQKSGMAVVKSAEGRVYFTQLFVK